MWLSRTLRDYSVQKHIEWNPTTQLWEMRENDLFSEHSEPYSVTFPNSGMTRNGQLLPLAKSAHRTDGNGYSSLLPTPTAQDRKNNGGPAQLRRNSLPLNALVTLLPTPATADGDRGPDLARAGRSRSGADDLVTFTVKVTRAQQWDTYEKAIRRWEELTRPAPSPTEPNTRGNPRLNPAFSEWMMGWPAGWVTDIAIHRRSQLRMIGNGCVPQQAVAALEYLLDN
jgi:hypothetical protein